MNVSPPLQRAWNPPFPVRTAISAPLRRAAVVLPAMVLFLCLPACSAWGADPSGAAEATPDIRVGLSGAFKVGRWARLECRGAISAPSAALRLEVDAPDPDGSAVTYHSEPFVPSSGTDAPRIGLLFKMGRLDGTLRVRVFDGERLLTNKALRVGADPDADVRAPFRQSVYLVANVQAVRDAAAAPGLPAGKRDVPGIGKLLSANNESAANGGNSASRTWTEVVDIDSFAELPTGADAYDAFDAVLLTQRFGLDEGADPGPRTVGPRRGTPLDLDRPGRGGLLEKLSCTGRLAAREDSRGRETARS